MPLRPCLDCRKLTDEGSRCADCRRAKDRARGTTTERGYGHDHQVQQEDPAYRAATHCETCGEPFTEDNPKTAGHRTAIRHGGGDGSIFAECASCNYGWRRTGS